jgi:hypothetical protein
MNEAAPLMIYEERIEELNKKLHIACEKIDSLRQKISHITVVYPIETASNEDKLVETQESKVVSAITHSNTIAHKLINDIDYLIDSIKY